MQVEKLGFDGYWSIVDPVMVDADVRLLKPLSEDDKQIIFDSRVAGVKVYVNLEPGFAFMEMHRAGSLVYANACCFSERHGEWANELVREFAKTKGVEDYLKPKIPLWLYNVVSEDVLAEKEKEVLASESMLYYLYGYYRASGWPVQ